MVVIGQSQRKKQGAPVQCYAICSGFSPSMVWPLAWRWLCGFILIAIVGLVITGVAKESPDLDDWSVLRLGFRRLMILWEAQKKRFSRRP